MECTCFYTIETGWVFCRPCEAEYLQWRIEQEQREEYIEQIVVKNIEGELTQAEAVRLLRAA